MQIISALAGELTRSVHLIQSHTTNATQHNYSVTTNHIRYSLNSIISSDYEVQIVQALMLQSDTLYITGSDKFILLFSLESEFSFIAQGFSKQVVINPYSYNILYIPDRLQLECVLKEKKQYSLFLTSLPFALLKELTPTKHSQDFLNKILSHEPAVLFKKNIVVKKRVLNMARELITMQTEPGLLESSKALALETIKEDEASEVEKRIFRVSAYIDDFFLDKDLTLELIAKELHEDINFIKKHFHLVIDKTVHQYIIQKKVGFAEILLATPKKIEEIAQILRMDESNLYRAFIKIHGISPKDYRKRIQ